MKTYKDLLTEALTPTGVVESALEAADGKFDRKAVEKALTNIEETYEKIVEYALSPDYEPARDNPKQLIEGINKKVRHIDKPRFFPEQILHHILIRNFKQVVQDGLYEQVYGCLPKRLVKVADGKYKVRKYGPHAAAKQLAKWVQTGEKTFVKELDIKQAYSNVHIPTLIAMLERVIKDEKWLALAKKFLKPTHPGNKGLILGHYTSPWFFNFYLKQFDHYMASIPEIKYLRFADNLFIVGTNKRKVGKAGQLADEYLNEELHMELNGTRQLYRFEYCKKGFKKAKGRPVNAIGAVVHHNRTTLRKSTLFRMRGKANRIARKQRKLKTITWHDACSMVARLGPTRHTQIRGYTNKYVYSQVNVKLLKRKIRNHSKAKTEVTIERRERIENAVKRILQE